MSHSLQQGLDLNQRADKDEEARSQLHPQIKQLQVALAHQRTEITQIRIFYTHLEPIRDSLRTRSGSHGGQQTLPETQSTARENISGRVSLIESIRAQLQVQKATLDSVHVSLQHFIDQRGQPKSCHAPVSISGNISASVDAVSVFRSVAALASMLLLGFSPTSLMSAPDPPLQPMIPCRSVTSVSLPVQQLQGSRPASREDLDIDLAKRSQVSAPSQQQTPGVAFGLFSTSEWAEEEQPKLRKMKAPKGMVWYCDQCCDGPLTDWQEQCGICGHVRCGDCCDDKLY